jgi:CRISPR-associated protein Csb2
MPDYLDLTVRFLMDRYHGGDWPPSPARLFQALVAGAKTGPAAAQWEDRHQSALEWLERQEYPEIFARASAEGCAYTLYVPNNSLDANRKSTSTSKPVHPRILKDHEVGQPDLLYRWQLNYTPEIRRHAEGLDELASRLRALGWGIDFAAACVNSVSNPAALALLERFVPDTSGDIPLPTPRPGLLQHLNDCHRAFKTRITSKGVNPNTRPSEFGEARYRNTAAAPGRRFVAFDLKQLEDAAFAIFPWHQIQIVAAMLRHAAKEAMAEEEMDSAWIDSYICGHTEAQDLGHRLSYVPLPSIGHQHADGGIRRVMIVEPPSPTPTDREALDLLTIKLSGRILTDHGSTERALLSPPENTGAVLPFYKCESAIWESVTPVCLHGFNTSRGDISLAKTNRLLCQAFEAAGFSASNIASMTFQPAPYWGGCAAAGRIRVPDHLSKWPKLHVRVEFHRPVRGPVLAGIGRHYGIGLFAARYKPIQDS